MFKLLDARTSQRASYANSISEPITAVDAPELVGIVGLNTSDAAGPITVQLEGVVSVEVPLLPVVTNITVTVVRGRSPSDLAVFSITENLSTSVLGPQTISFAGSDFEVPANDQLVYTMFIESDVLGTIRVGPESFNAAAYAEEVEA